MSQPTLNTSPRRLRSATLALAALLPLTTAFLTMGGTLAHASTGQEAAPAGGCTGDEGVTVVVDFTDVGGDIEAGCATGDPASGRDALESAGFTPEDSTPGMICTIDGLPDPCPEEFDGSFWSYWYAEDDAWASYQVGADEADPAPGSVDGWRYFDGTVGPQVDPAAVVAAAPVDAGTEVATDTQTNADTTDSDKPDADKSSAAEELAEGDGSDPAGVIAAGAVAVVLIAGIVLVLRRRRAMRED